MFPFLLLHLLLFLTAAVRAADFQGSTHKVAYEEDPIRYTERKDGGPVAELQAQINRGDLQLKYDAEHGYLPALLKALQVPKSSQLLVFSKTSLQRSYISPKNPRAIYFNDDIYIGYIPGSPLIEISAVDPKSGPMFYAIEQTAAFKPQLVRSADCLQCHGGSRSLGVPGHVVRSVGTDASGEIEVQTEVSEITHCTPLADRWAGWFVTGQHGRQEHRGNLIGSDDFERQKGEPNFAGNVTDLKPLTEIGKFPAQTSDIVAHLVLEHQSHMHNYITRLAFETQIMMSTYGHIRYLDRQADAFLRYLLFVEETPLTEPISGDPQFAQDFASTAARDKQGRSLRDFDLHTRLFKYPCSFLILSPAFDSIPDPMREHLYQRLWNILTAKDQSGEFAKLPATDRQAVLEILLQTKEGLPDYWKAS